MRRLLLRRTAAASLALLLAFALPAPGQKDSGAVVREKASVTIIEVPVNVIGRDGKPVAGLTADDFELYDEGKKQPISGFEVVDLQKTAAPAARPEVAPEISPSARRLWLIVFDLSYTSASGLLRARDGARAFVANSMRPDDLAAVGTLSVDTGWKLLVNFTRDRRQLTRAVDTLGLPGLGMRSGDPLAFAFELPNPSGSPTGAAATSKGEALTLENLRDLQNLQKQANDDLARGRVAKLVGSLAGIGRVLDSVRGRKHVLFFSEGFETRLLSGNASGGQRDTSLQQPSSSSAFNTSTPLGAGDAALSGEIWKIDSDARFGSSSMRDRLAAALSAFKRSDAVLDAIDISGLRAEGDVGAAKPGSGTDALFTMASETDGDFVRNANQLGGELERVAVRTSLVYLLVYQPRQLTKPGTFHTLKVKVKTPGAKVLARSGYYEPRPYRSLSPLEQLLASGDLVTGGSRENAFPVQILATPFAGQGGLAQVPVVLEIPGRPLLTGDAGPKTGIQIFAYATDESGTLWDYASQEITLDLERVRPALEAGGLKFLGTLSLPAGDYSVRTLVRNASTGNSAVATARVRVAEVPGSTPVVLAPLFQEPSGRWTMVKAGPRADAPARATEYPFSVGGDSFIPSALPVLARGATAQVAVVTFNLAGARMEPLQVLSEILGPDGKPRKADVQILRRSDKEREGGRALLLAFSPEALEPGRYLFKVRVSDRISRRTAEASTPFEVK